MTNAFTQHCVIWRVLITWKCNIDYLMQLNMFLATHAADLMPRHHDRVAPPLIVSKRFLAVPRLSKILLILLQVITHDSSQMRVIHVQVTAGAQCVE